MSAAANAVGYLYAHGRLAAAEPSSQTAAPSQPTKRAQPTSPAPQRDAQSAKQPGTTKIEYRKRRVYPLPAVA